MSLTLILGPMKSGKSLELIARIAPYEFSNKKVLYVQPVSNTRDNGVTSRTGLRADSIKVKSLKNITMQFDVIGIDEVFMFPISDVEIIKNWIQKSKIIIISSLDLDYRGSMIETIKLLMEQKPEVIVYKISVCDICKNYDAGFTQILHNSKPVTGGLPTIVPEDGTFDYESRCRYCFIR